ncbi:hypothetical protein GOBAR_DD16048 [Gossypium barbadense]|nr:hypothetical protein GOBAR_DD16048 [Gossypium barbadense]
MLNTTGKVEERNLARPFYFRFNANWVLDENFEEQVIEGWKACMGDVPEKLSMPGTNLSRWASKNKAWREGRKQGLFSKFGAAVGEGDRIFESSQPCISDFLNEDLMADFQNEEVVEAVKSMSPLKA